MENNNNKISKCVVCFDNKARFFCIGCKKSSGLCEECNNKMSKHSFRFQRSCFTEELHKPCVICKEPMRYAKLVKKFNKRMSSGNIYKIDHLFKFHRVLKKRMKIMNLRDILKRNRDGYIDGGGGDDNNTTLKKIYKYKKNKLSSTYNRVVLIQSVYRRYINNVPLKDRYKKLINYNKKFNNKIKEKLISLYDLVSPVNGCSLSKKNNIISMINVCGLLAIKKHNAFMDSIKYVRKLSKKLMKIKTFIYLECSSVKKNCSCGSCNHCSDCESSD